ncbi:hypothetical protein D3C72_2443880 [compost metagenome]
MVSRFIQRVSDAMTSFVVTGWPSWNLRPGRSLNVQVSLSGAVSKLSTICGLGWRFESQAKSVS